MAKLAPLDKLDVVAALRQRMLQWQGAGRPTFSTGLDSILPGGFQRGTLVEYLAEGGSGATALSLVAAREACREDQTLVVIDRRRQFYPPAASNFGLGTKSMIFAHPGTRSDELWTLNQALSCPGVGAVLCWPEKLDDRVFRSLQLAAERGGAVGLFIRPASIRGQPTWSEIQLLVEVLPAAEKIRRLRVEMIRCRNGNAGASVEVVLNDETGTVQESRSMHLATGLAAPAVAASAPGA